MVRAKFSVSKIARYYYAGKEQPGVEITLTPQYDTTIPEDHRFAQATPSGEMRLYVDNPSAAAALIAGGTFYVDFTPVAQATAES